jgi:hypothetical protein
MSRRLPLSGYEPIFDPRDYSIIGFNCYDYAIGYQDKRNNKKPHNNKSTPGGRNFTNNVTRCAGLNKGILKDNPKAIKKCSNPNKVCGRGYYKIMSFVSPGNDFHFYRQVQTVRYKIAAGNTVTGLARYFKVSPSVIRAAAKKLKTPTNLVNGNINSNSNLSNIAQAKNANKWKNSNNLKNNANNNTNRTVLVPGKIIEFKCNLWAHKQGWGTRPLMVDASGKTIADPRKANRNYGSLNYSNLCGVFCVRAGKAKSGNA